MLCLEIAKKTGPMYAHLWIYLNSPFFNLITLHDTGGMGIFLRGMCIMKENTIYIYTLYIYIYICIYIYIIYIWRLDIIFFSGFIKYLWLTKEFTHIFQIGQKFCHFFVLRCIRSSPVDRRTASFQRLTNAETTSCGVILVLPEDIKMCKKFQWDM